MKLPAVALVLAISIPLANAYTGDLTHYTPGMGSCGIVNKNGDAIVALSADIMLSFSGNANDNPLCNKQISIHNPTTGTNTIATVTDTCQGCAFDNIDVPDDLFYTVAPEGNGRVPGIEWTPVGWTVPGGSGDSESTAAQSGVSSVVQPSSVAAAIPSAALPSIHLQEKVAAVVPSAAAAAPSGSSSTSAAPSSVSAVAASVAPSAASPSNTQTASAPTDSITSCTTAGETVCSADGTQIGTCTMELTVQLGRVAQGTKCVGGYMVMANSRLRSRRN
ncbi:hypothetical protein HO133_005345 [Letharia lupina]|uniref:RlpA-like protein double-psi beta-barrel domain-containing protein n=1 Tax=Letharia lupina TaxID=560253 RepID=A0A8H6C8F2_9LECA|nr:uncharacterized protein HO133_005345 [Letharia lupina]KAF6218802.1 hypothetical protein HO133_005345 [Letharia lupina]